MSYLDCLPREINNIIDCYVVGGPIYSMIKQLIELHLNTTEYKPHCFNVDFITDDIYQSLVNTVSLKSREDYILNNFWFDYFNYFSKSKDNTIFKIVNDCLFVDNKKDSSIALDIYWSYLLTKDPIEGSDFNDNFDIYYSYNFEDQGEYGYDINYLATLFLLEHPTLLNFDFSKITINFGYYYFADKYNRPIYELFGLDETQKFEHYVYNFLLPLIINKVLTYIKKYESYDGRTSYLDTKLAGIYEIMLKNNCKSCLKIR